MRRIKIAVLLVLRALGLFWLSRLITRDRLRILCYHGGQIGDEGRYNPLLFGSSKIVRQRMKWLRSHGFGPVSIDVLDQDPQDMRSVKLPVPRPVLITIDDGWYSSVKGIADVCNEEGFPVCIYLATRYVMNGLPVAPVVMGYMVWRRKVHALSFQDIASDVMPFKGDYDLTRPPDRSRFIAEAVAWLESLPEDRALVVSAMETLAGLLGVSATELNLVSRRFDYLTPLEIAGLESRKLSFQVHGHVHHYPKGDVEALKADIGECIRVLKGMGISAPRHYCYPSGAFDEGAQAAFSDLGVLSGTTCIPGLVNFRRITSFHYLPRFLDGENVSQIEFEAEMSGVMDFIRGVYFRLRPASRPALVGV